MPTASDSRSARRERPRKPTTRENVWYWVKAIVAILILRAFIAEPYRIPSESMEDTLLVGDFLIVSKLHWGPRTPATVGVPFTRVYADGLEAPQVRLPGFTAPERGDVAVFNYPAGRDVVIGEIPASVPIERRGPYIKRLVAVPGDTVAVLDKVLHVNGTPQPLAPTMKQNWLATAVGDDRPNARRLDDLGVTFVGDVPDSTGRGLASPRQFVISGTPVEADAVEALGAVADVGPYIQDETQVDVTFGANPDHWSPRVVPGAGMTVALTDALLPIYAETITRHEGRRLERAPDGGVLVDGVPAETYTFTQDYYVALGDSRDDSVDSRFWGFVPHSHLVGKAVFVMFSFERWLPPIPRLNRFFRPIP